MRVNGETFTEFKSISLQKSMDSIAGSFSFSIAEEIFGDSGFGAEDIASFNIGSTTVVSGAIEKVTANISRSNHTTVMTGYDRTIDIVDSNIYAPANYAFTSFEDLVKTALKDNGITDIFVEDVTDNKDDFDKDSKQVAETGDTIFNFLQIYANKANKTMTAVGYGQLEINNSGASSRGTSVANSDSLRTDVLSSSKTVDFSNRFSKVIVKSQSDFGGELNDDISGIAEDKEVTRGGVKVIVAESSLTQEEAERLAKLEVNKRRSNSIVYNCKVKGFYSSEGHLWEPNIIVFVIDRSQSIYSKMLLQSVKYSFTREGGSVCDLTLVSPDTYTLKTQASNFYKGLKKEDV